MRNRLHFSPSGKEVSMREAQSSGLTMSYTRKEVLVDQRQKVKRYRMQCATGIPALVHY